MSRSRKKMGKRGRLDQPRGEKITINTDERERLKKLREAKGMSQGVLADKIGVSQGTISNMESGAHKQMLKSAYADLLRVLEAPSEATPLDASWKSLFQNAAKLDADQIGMAEQFVAMLAASRKPPP